MRHAPRWFRALEVLCAIGAAAGVVMVIAGGGWKYIALIAGFLLIGSIAIKLGFVAKERTKHRVGSIGAAIVMASILIGPSAVNAMSTGAAPETGPPTLPNVTVCLADGALAQEEAVCAGLEPSELFPVMP